MVFYNDEGARRSFLSRGVQSFTGLLSLATLFQAPSTLHAQQPLQIDSTSMEVSSNKGVRFQFRSEAASAEDFEIESTPELSPIPTWNRSLSAMIEAIAENVFRVTDAAPTQPLFYRVRALATNPPSASLLINEVMTDNVGYFADGERRFWDWIEIYNPNDESVALAGYGLSDDEALLGRWRFPSQFIQPHGFVLVFASDLNISEAGQPLHANFKLKASGESLFLSDPLNHVLDRLEIPSMASNQSLGRIPDGGEEFGFFGKTTPSPGAPNSVSALSPPLASPTFMPEGGIHPSALSIEVKAAELGQSLHYTLDGSAPTAQSPLIPSSLPMNKTTVVRVLAIDGQGRKSDIASRTYLVGVTHLLPIVSLATAPTNMSFRDGYLYGMGPSVLNNQNQVIQSYPYSGSYAWKDREVEVALEFFEPGGAVGLRQRAGMKIYGGWGSRGYPQKSLALFARRSYGSGKFSYRIFPDEPVDEFESFVLRNSGNDNQSTHQTPPRPPITNFSPTTSYGSYFVNGTFTMLRDAFLQRLLEGTTLDTQGYRPAVVYVNGDYWGIYNIREKITEHHVLSHHDLPAGSIDLIEGYGTVRAGTGTLYNQLRQYLSSKSMAVETNYAFVEQNYLDIDNFIDYHLAVIYFQNFDIGNIKCWRPRQARGRFRWLVYDQDYGFGLWPASVYVPAMARDYSDYENMFRFYTGGTGTSEGWPNAGGRTLMLRSLLNNSGFKERFIRRCADLLNSLFREDRVENTLQTMAAVIRPEISAHLQRWSWEELVKRGYGKPHQPEHQPFTRETWETNLTVISEFGRSRPQKLRQDCLAHFQLKSGLGIVEVDVEPMGSGTLRVNSLGLDSFPWRGTYFADFPVTLIPIPKPGFRFAGWQTPAGIDSIHRLDFNLVAGVTNRLVAKMVTAAAVSSAPSDLIFTEIQYHPSSDAESGDWVELHHRGTIPLDLSGWVFRDGEDSHCFALPERVLAPGEAVVLCQDDFKFRLFQSVGFPCHGNFEFGLKNSGDSLRLYRPDGSLATSMTYGTTAPWPPEADGIGYTLQLTTLDSDPSLPASWKRSAQKGGTPGR